MRAQQFMAGPGGGGWIVGLAPCAGVRRPRAEQHGSDRAGADARAVVAQQLHPEQFRNVT